MVKMRFLDVSKIPVLKVVVVLTVMDPFFQNIALDDTSQQHRGRVDRKYETHRDGDHEDGKQILDPTVNVRTVKRSFMMSEMSRV